jgi:tRNA pseudouridine55 synthase
MQNPASRKARDSIHGVLLLDKPVGLSSNEALLRCKRLLNAKKGGHTGTLDPFASGLLPLCFGEATKFAQDLLEADKTYDTTVRLGEITTTGDTEGDIISVAPVDVSAAQITAALERFRGAIQQVPPMYSALKRDGKPLYEYARAGVVLERAPRAVTIHSLELLSIELPDLVLRVRCSKGTYVRTLGEDIGAALGCGAHLRTLRRLVVGPLLLDDAVSLDEIDALAQEARVQRLLPVDALLRSLPQVCLSALLAERFLHGQRLALEKEGLPLLPAGAKVSVYRDTTLLGTARITELGVLAPERLVVLD